MERGCFLEPQSVKKAGIDFRVEADTLRAFVLDRIEFGEWSNRADCYRAYRLWALENGVGTLSARAYHSRILAICQADGHPMKNRTRHGREEVAYSVRSD